MPLCSFRPSSSQKRPMRSLCVLESQVTHRLNAFIQIFSYLKAGDETYPAHVRSVPTVLSDAIAAEQAAQYQSGHRNQSMPLFPRINFISALELYSTAADAYLREVSRCRASCLSPYNRARPLSPLSSLRAQDVFEQALKLVFDFRVEVSDTRAAAVWRVWSSMTM